MNFVTGEVTDGLPNIKLNQALTAKKQHCLPLDILHHLPRQRNMIEKKVILHESHHSVWVGNLFRHLKPILSEWWWFTHTQAEKSHQFIITSSVVSLQNYKNINWHAHPCALISVHSKQYVLSKEPYSTITMQTQENPAGVLLGLHGNSTLGFLLKNLYCSECIAVNVMQT